MPLKRVDSELWEDVGNLEKEYLELILAGISVELGVAVLYREFIVPTH